MGFKKAKHRATGVPGQVRCFFLRYYRNPNIYGSSIANAGQIQAGNDSAILLIGSGATFNLTGAGTVSLGAENTVLEGYFGNENLVNQGNTIQGQGSIQFLASFQNQGTVNAGFR
jgi:hypothetical protein